MGTSSPPFASSSIVVAFVLGGMPTVTLSDAAAMRLETISFFLVGFLLSAWGVKGLWNLLRRDWPALPRLSYRAALGLTGLWGLLFVLVLTMISGTRELLTPGAWEKRGVTYTLKGEEEAKGPAVRDASVEERRRKLEGLGRALLAFAAKMRDGKFPGRREAAEIKDELWQLPNRPATYYVYVPNGTKGARDGKQIIAYEPMMYGDDPLVLLSDGSVVPMTLDEVEEELPESELQERAKLWDPKAEWLEQLDSGSE